MKIAVILVNYNGIRYNMACVESLLRQQADCLLKIIVVDNASRDLKDILILHVLIYPTM